jgi:hypothetical protein
MQAGKLQVLYDRGSNQIHVVFIRKEDFFFFNY